jgi:hypothetical protein
VCVSLASVSYSRVLNGIRMGLHHNAR